MNYTNKYLKYKNKYLNLLKLRGGNPYEIINISVTYLEDDKKSYALESTDQNEEYGKYLELFTMIINYSSTESEPESESVSKPDIKSYIIDKGINVYVYFRLNNIIGSNVDLWYIEYISLVCLMISNKIPNGIIKDIIDMNPSIINNKSGYGHPRYDFIYYKTPLHLACEILNKELVEILLGIETININIINDNTIEYDFHNKANSRTSWRHESFYTINTPLYCCLFILLDKLKNTSSSRVFDENTGQMIYIDFDNDINKIIDIISLLILQDNIIIKKDDNVFKYDDTTPHFLLITISQLLNFNEKEDTITSFESRITRIYKYIGPICKMYEEIYKKYNLRYSITDQCISKNTLTREEIEGALPNELFPEGGILYSNAKKHFMGEEEEEE